MAVLDPLSGRLLGIAAAYDDTEAVDAMGVKGNANPLNHDRYTDADAVTAQGAKANDNPLNHDRYTDGEASAAAPVQADDARLTDQRDASSLQTVPVSAATPGDRDHLVFIGGQWVATEPTPSIGQAVNLFLDDSASGVSTYHSLLREPAGGAEDVDTGVCNSTSGEVLIDAYASAAIGALAIAAGAWQFHTFLSVSSTVGVSTVVIRVFSRAAGGAETPLFNLTTPEINSAAAVLVDSPPSVQPEFSVATTDVIVVKYYAQTTSASNRTISLYHNGAAHYSYITTPIASTHNDMVGRSEANAHPATALSTITAIILGRVDAGAGPVQEVSPADIRTLLNVADGATADQSDAAIATAYANEVAAASQVEAEAGTEAGIRRMSPLRIAQAIAALGGGGGGGTVQGTDGTYDIEAANEGATAGNARGENSVDLCTVRSDASYVCAGANCGAVGGENVGGTSAGTHTFFAAGKNNYNNSGDYCSISGYFNHSNSGDYCSISGTGNYSNTGSYCSISGTTNYSNTGSYCSISGSGNFNNSGDYCSISGSGNNSNFGSSCNISGSGNSSNTGSYCNISGSGNYSNSGYYCNISGSSNHSNAASYCIIGGKDNDYIHTDADCSLIVGELNSKSGTDASEGSHCIIGGKNNYNNSGDYCSISGSGNFSNSGDYCSISGSTNLYNSGTHCSISGSNNYSNTGNYCNISGFYNHSNSGKYCSISGANNSSNSGTHCNISGYINYSNSGTHCSISGSNNYSNTGNYCNISGFYNHSNSGKYCSISGRKATSNALSYARVHGGNVNARIIDLVAQIDSSGTGATELLLGGTGGTRIIIPDQSAWNVDVRFVAKTATGANAAIQNFTGLIVRDGTSTTYAAGTSDAAITEIGTSNAAFTVAADDTNEALKLTVAASSGVLRASARIQLTQVDY